MWCAEKPTFRAIPYRHSRIMRIAAVADRGEALAQQFRCVVHAIQQHIILLAGHQKQVIHFGKMQVRVQVKHPWQDRPSGCIYFITAAEIMPDWEQARDPPVFYQQIGLISIIFFCQRGD